MNKGLKSKVIELYSQGKSYNQISEELGCSKGTISFHVSSMAEEKIHKVRREKKKQIETTINEVKESKGLTLKDFEDIYRMALPLKDFLKLRNELFEKKYITKELSVADYHKNRRRQIKKELVDIKGGKCQVCGYNKCLRSLEFHHLDPLQKDFTISGNLKRIKREKVIKELEKCILVCSNCHGEIHDGLIRVDTRED